MDSGFATVLAATVTGAFALFSVYVNKFRKENRTDHQVVIGLLHVLRKSQLRVEDKVEKVDERLSNHLEFHVEQGVLDNGRTIDQTRVEGDSDLSS
jgi:hypothetical protein